MLILLYAAVFLADACGTGPTCLHGDCVYGDGAYFCQCKRGWAGAACDAPRAGFRKITSGAKASIDEAVNYACLVNEAECTGSNKCTYYAGAYSCDPCPSGFVSYEGECLPKKCFNNNGDYSDNVATKPPCNGRGRCLLKDPRLAGLSADDYACDCYPIYRGGLCQSCDDANAIDAKTTSQNNLPTCNARACQDPDGTVCSDKGTCTLDVGLDRESYHYRCKCNTGYTRVGHKCVRTECVATIDGSPVVCGGFGECTEEGSTGVFKCVCDSNAVKIGNFCAPSTCTDSSNSKICGGVGACVRHGAGYKCDCRGLATGDLCDTCTPGKSVQVGDVCVPVGCLTDKQTSCVGGTCVNSNGEYHCRCPDMLVAINGECTSPACMDEELGKVCSGHGTCKTDDPKDIKCTCGSDYTYIAPGRCILSALVDSPATVCSGHGRIVVSAETPSTMKCQCSSIYTGTKCETCGPDSAQMIDGKCVAKKCIVQQQPPDPQPNVRTPTAQDICGDTGTYTTYGDPSNPFITCIPKDSSSGNVSAYNGTFSAKPGCVYTSKIDKARRFFCGFLEGLTDSLQDNMMPTCARPSENPNLPETCTACPKNFNRVFFGENNSTCMHRDCHDGESIYHMWYSYCGGVGDCVKKKDNSGGYECDCGADARWDPKLKTCVTDACKLDKKLAGPGAPEYCAKLSSHELHCTVGRDATWQCNCTGEYITYNKTCILKSKNANPQTKLARGLCGGPGAGYINDNESCTCNPGFIRIGDMCYSYDCLPVGVTATDARWLDPGRHVCSGKGICAYNQLTGRYGCECKDGFQAFGGYCTHPGCVSKVVHNGELKYVECKVYDGTAGSCTQDSGKDTYSCKCESSYKFFNGICVHQGCMPEDKYCGGDTLASCMKGSDGLYGCVCSEGYELSDKRGQDENRDTCVPSKCMYKASANDAAVECNGLGTCSANGLLKDKECTCTNGANQYTLRDASGELKKTCVLEKCISSKDGEVPIICGGSGRCGPEGCICNLGTELVDKVCVGVNCFINTTDDSGKLTRSVCGGETIGVCTKIASHGDRRDYACKCKDPKPDGYEELDGFCLPKACIFEITNLDNTKTRTTCGGKQFGTCILNATQSSTPYCKCIDRYDIVQLDNKKCIKRECRSDVLPGDNFRNVECSSHGTCKGDHVVGYSCTCESGYKTVKGVLGTYLCIPDVCAVSETDTAMVCSGKGTCSIDEQKCKCHAGYEGPQCKACEDGFMEHTDKRCYRSSCPKDGCSMDENTNAGTCQFGGGSFDCVCVNSSFVVDSNTKKCRKSKCVWTDPYDNVEKTCYGMGTCNDNGEDTGGCSCNSGTTLIGSSVCVYRECMPKDHADDITMICNKRGTCVEATTGKGICRCDSSKYRTDKKTGQCFVKECFGAHESLLSEVCDGGGTCNESAKTCECHAPDFKNLPGQNGCVHSNCVSSNNKLCSGFGACEKTGSTYGCLCANYYTLVKTDCIPTRCLNQTVVCNNGGTCSGEGSSAVCSCKSGWALHGTLCYPSACVSDGALCGGNGDCQLSDGGSCTCRSGYETVSGKLCISSQCVQRGTDGTATICGGNGRCVSENGVAPSCVCNEGFSLTSKFVCGVPASNKSSAGTTAAIVVVLLLVLAAVAGFLIWWFVIRPKRAGVLRERAPRKPGPGLPKPQLSRNSSLTASMYSTAPLLSGSRQTSMVQL
ncbi:High cysteine membrane EGF-like protein [Giardia lamblia P15]|uniref:High cysteine membrane EGF-like protein n=1 Tax=Giardia intestinalis (strain P15) TaxID=658858 RepID=E1EZ59_GIAIA|nr:High cysteine membrane EGF-like protein [Giardia lamblia P15]